MIASPHLSWLLTAVFAATGLWFLVRCVRSVAGTPVPGITGRVSCAACAVMSMAMIGMSWSWGMSLPVWPQVAVFALATVWFAVLATHSRRPKSGRLPHVHNALMMAAVIWMIATMPVSMTRSPLGMAGIIISVVLATYFLLAALSWISQAMHTKRNGHAYRLDAISHAAMSIGMGMMLFLMT